MNDWEKLFQAWKNSVVNGPVGRLPTHHEIGALIEERDQLKAEVESLRAKVKLAVWQRDVEMWNNPTLTGKRQELIRSYNASLEKE